METFRSKMFSFVLGVFGLGMLGLAGWPIFGAFKSDGEVDYCYIGHEVIASTQQTVQNNTASTVNSSVTVFSLLGHRPWREDRKIGTNYPSVEAAKDDADRMGCRLR